MNVYITALWDEFVNFIGGRSGLAHWVFYLAALFVCMLTGRGMRRRLFWPSVLVLLLFFNPLFYWLIGTRFLSGIYWRLLWMLPVSFVTGYALTQFLFRFRRRFLRLLVLLAACACIAVTGKPVFSAETYREKENDYELPQAAIEIADIVEARLENWKETLIVPEELLCSIRQYSCSAGLLYGRNAGGFISSIEEDEAQVHWQMSQEVPDLELITRIAKEKNCRYIVFNTAFHQIPEDLTEYGYGKIATVQEKYAMYCRISEQ